MIRDDDFYRWNESDCYDGEERPTEMMPQRAPTPVWQTTPDKAARLSEANGDWRARQRIVFHLRAMLAELKDDYGPMSRFEVTEMLEELISRVEAGEI